MSDPIATTDQGQRSLKRAVDALSAERSGRSLLTSVYAQLAERGQVAKATYEEFDRLVTQAQSPFWDIQVDSRTSQTEKDAAHVRMVELATLRGLIQRMADG